MTRARLILSGVTLSVVAIAVVLVLGADTLSAAFAAGPSDGQAGQTGTGETDPVTAQAVQNFELIFKQRRKWRG